MRSFRRPAMLLALAVLGTANAADEAKSVDARKKQAEANWATVSDVPATQYESKHFLILAPEAMAKRLKSVGELLEKHHDKAKEVLKFEIKDDSGEVLPGKVIVYLLGERDQFKAFVRRIEGRRLQPDETSSMQAADDKLHIVVAPPAQRGGTPVEAQAGEQAASLLLARRAGLRTPLPDWLVSGFGRATYYRAAPRDKAVVAERALAAKLSRKHGAEEIWDGKLAADEAAVLQASLVDFLAYGPGTRAFPKFVAGFAPEENRERKTTGQAFESAGLKPDRVASSWKTWAAKANSSRIVKPSEVKSIRRPPPSPDGTVVSLPLLRNSASMEANNDVRASPCEEKETRYDSGLGRSPRFAGRDNLRRSTLAKPRRAFPSVDSGERSLPAAASTAIRPRQRCLDSSNDIRDGY
jgi:hypothetical protein